MRNSGDITEEMDEKFDATDRISQLPEFIIHHMMSFLDTKDVARTSLLSKRWNNLRESFPILNFSEHEFNKDLSYNSHDSPEIQEIKEKFVTFVDGSLRSFNEHRLCMQKFALYMTFDLKLASHVDKWVGLAIDNNVKDLIIRLDTEESNEWYHLPETVFATKSITSLKIVGCKLELLPNKFCSLQKLYLSNLYVDEDMIQNFVHKCPLIKYFALSSAWGFKRFCVSELSYLENVIVSPALFEFEEVYVEAPSLKAFCFDSGTRLNSLTINVPASQDLKRLCISFYCITERFLQNLISEFPNLEELRLGYSNMERIAISSHKLKSLIIRSNKLAVAEIDAPNLRVFKYQSTYNMPVLSSTSALCQWEIELDVPILDSHRFLKLREFLDNLNCRKFLNLVISCSKEVMFDSEDLIEKSLPLPYELEHLTLSVQGSANLSAFVDGLFWCCHPKMISIKSGYGCNNTFIKLLSDKLMDVEVRSCCTSSQIKCWVHCVEDVYIESFEGKSDEKFHDWNTLLDALPTLATGTKLCFRFNWRSY